MGAKTFGYAQKTFLTMLTPVIKRFGEEGSIIDPPPPYRKVPDDEAPTCTNFDVCNTLPA